ncbi:hypothetical protein H4R18_000768 [Coemansia javaensis]|uniref:Uncharacterized protein n=1 Tax=Coemansia javaensis TaxID=2761396 RepID=A0A9W8LLP1_9FUNG|nr:hypothetical protein H4R18_000768 [Coemansia javaensis]
MIPFVISEVPEYEVEDRSKDEDSSDDENSSDEDLANGIPIVIVEDVTIIVPNNFSTFDANEWDSDEDYEDYEDD